MKKIEINNEIVSLRQFVRQARTCIINKLTREAKKLRTSHKDEKQLEKNKNKAEKLLREVFALKRVKEDEISKFGIINFKNLQQILQNPLTNDETRAIVKVICFKALSPRILALQEKFPDCEEYISLEKKGKRKRNSATDSPEKHQKQLKIDTNDRIQKVQEESEEDVENVTVAIDVPDQKKKKVDEKCEKLSKKKEETKNEKECSKNFMEIQKNHNTETVNGKCEEVSEEKKKRKECKETVNGKCEEVSEEKKKRKECKENSIEIQKIHNTETESENSQSCKLVAKVISKEATVKRFTQMLEENENQNCEEMEEENDEHEKIRAQNKEKQSDGFQEIEEPSNQVEEMEMDDFFLHASKPTSCTTVTLFPKDESRSIMQINVKSHQVNSKINKFSNRNISKISDNRKPRINSKDYYNRNSTKETSKTQWKQNRKFMSDEGNESVTSKNVENENLHPSWAAKKKQQDIMKQGFQGKKIKFDED